MQLPVINFYHEQVLTSIKGVVPKQQTTVRVTPKYATDVWRRPKHVLFIFGTCNLISEQKSRGENMPL